MTAAERLEALVAAVRAEYCPDPRTCVFEIDLRVDGDSITLVGSVSEPAAAEALHRRVALLEGWGEVRDGVVRLPAAHDGEMHHAIITASVAPMLAGPMIVTPPVSQVVLGHRLLVLRRRGRWLQCRSEDGYVGWVHRGYVEERTESEARAWEIGADGAAGEACISVDADLRLADDESVVRLPWGARVIRGSDGTVRLPAGRAGRVERGELISAAERQLRFPARGEAVVESATRWLGAPYQWSGVTRAGVDCSGLVQTLYRMHGVELPRDSDQQAKAGAAVDPGRDFTRLRAGDLCVFAEELGRVTHVVLSTGGPRIIHSSLGNGGVARNDLVGELPYERELRRIFVGARRVIVGE